MSILQCAINGPTNSGIAYFFQGDHFVQYDWNRLTTDHNGNDYEAVYVSSGVWGILRLRVNSSKTNRLNRLAD
jgi:hypothetical protein